MPDPKDKAEASGDTRPPQAPETAQQRPRGRADTEGGHGSDHGDTLERELENEARAGQGENQAGFLKEKDGEAGRNT